MRRARKEIAATRNQRDEQQKASAPQAGLHPQRKGRLEKNWVGHQREEAADIGEGIKKIGVLAIVMSSADEPRLQKRIIGGECEKRQSDRDCE